jgi:hypothetical protein
MVAALIFFLVVIFAAPSGANTKYLAMVMQTVPPPTPTTSVPRDSC